VAGDLIFVDLCSWVGNAK